MSFSESSIAFYSVEDIVKLADENYEDFYIRRCEKLIDSLSKDNAKCDITFPIDLEKNPSICQKMLRIILSHELCFLQTKDTLKLFNETILRLNEHIKILKHELESVENFGKDLAFCKNNDLGMVTIFSNGRQLKKIVNKKLIEEFFQDDLECIICLNQIEKKNSQTCGNEGCSAVYHTDCFSQLFNGDLKNSNKFCANCRREYIPKILRQTNTIYNNLEAKLFKSSNEWPGEIPERSKSDDSDRSFVTPPEFF